MKKERKCQEDVKNSSSCLENQKIVLGTGWELELQQLHKMSRWKLCCHKDRTAVFLEEANFQFPFQRKITSCKNIYS